ncbi:unnamed protein product [Heligmosomoides polygyrus]|uniref:Uncharacterized protein n=1 Tax=Heligmosomoides polygyrus TaxID=6339 RepID=A0A3P8E2T7_HELPZ|nr:unnamed protein product [Heligmosomoides polygyrus]
MKEYCRIINIPSQLRRTDIQELIHIEIPDLIRYDNHADRSPIAWPIPIGKTNATFSMRVKMSYEFWTWFKRTGYRHLNELNTKNNWNMRLIQEKSLFNKDKENLCLYVRNKIKQLYQSHGKAPIPMKIERDHIQLKNIGTFDPIVLGKRLNISFEDWHGISLNALIDDKIRKEGGLKHLGPLELPGLGAENTHEEGSITRKRPFEESHLSTIPEESVKRKPNREA